MKTPLKTSAFAALAVMVAFAGTTASANAYDGHRGHGRDVKKVVVVKEVYKQPVRQVRRDGLNNELFGRLDMNNNGTVSRWEYAQRFGNDRYANRTFNRADVNRDGKLSQREVAAARDTLWKMWRA